MRARPASVALAGCLGLLLSLAATAVASAGTSVSLPGLSLTLPVQVDVPVELPVEVSVPSVTATVPSVEVSAAGTTVSTPSVTATAPSAEVSGSGASVSGGGVSSSGGGASVSSPIANPPGGSGESSGGGGHSAPSSPSDPSGGSGGGSGSPEAGGHGAGSGLAGDGGASTDGSALAHAASAGTSAVAGSQPGAGAGKRATRDGAGAKGRSPASSRGRHVTPRDMLLGSTAAAADTPPLVLRRADAARGAPTAARTGDRPSNPLDTIGKRIPLPLPVPDWSKPIILALLLLAAWFGARSRVAVRRARRLERQREALLGDVDAMQGALVPVIPARVGGLAVSVSYRPADGPAAGGDFYDVFVPTKGKVAVILGDVAGHGHGALTQAALTRYTLRAYLQTGLEPRAALALAGRVLGDPTAERFATVVVGVYDTRAGVLTFAGAGHPPPILQGLQTREPVTVCASPPIGWTVPTGRRQTTVSLPRGSVVCFYSDGLIEARCRDGLLGRERLDEMLGALGSRPRADKLLERVHSAADSTPDDMAACILVPEVTLISSATHVEELEVDGQSLANGHARRFLETCEATLPEIERALARAGELVTVFGSALLCVDLSGHTADVEVSAPAAAPDVAAGVQRQPKVGA